MKGLGCSAHVLGCNLDNPGGFAPPSAGSAISPCSLKNTSMKQEGLQFKTSFSVGRGAAS